MKQSFYLAWKYLSFNKIRTAILVACVTTIGVLPLSLNSLLSASEERLLARAQTTPLIVGAKGSDLDLAINTLYFASVPPEPISMSEVDAILRSELATAIPLYTPFKARNFPIVGTSLEYFEFRQLAIAQGSIFGFLGDCVLGAEVAKTLGLEVGDSIISSPETVFDLGGTYPLKMNVVGILAKNHTADDRAIFVDVKTTWIIQGLGHGHQEIAEASPEEDLILERDESNITANAKVMQYTEITPENIASFHFHGDPATFPLTAVLAIPRDRRSAAILRGRYETGEGDQQIVSPTQVVEELLLDIFKVRQILNLAFVLVTVATAIAIALIFNLSLRLRQREIETSFKLGCSRGTLFKLVVAEVAIVVAMSGSISLLVTVSLGQFEDQMTRLLISRISERAIENVSTANRLMTRLLISRTSECLISRTSERAIENVLTANVSNPNLELLVLTASS